MAEQYPGSGELEQFEGSHEAVPSTDSTDGGQVEGQQQGTPEDWKQAYENRQSWERSYKQKDQRFAKVRNVLETAFGRGMDEWNAIDFTDLQAFSMLNQRIRNDPEFAQRWHSALTQTFQESGATKAEASQKASEVMNIQREAAKAQPQQPQQPQKTEIPKEYLERMNRLEQIAIQQEFNALENNLWGELDGQVTAIASDLKEDFGDLIEEQALQGLFFHSDQELIARAHDGTLPQLVGAYVKRASDRIRSKQTANIQRRATAKKTAPPVPFGAQAGAAPSKDRNSMTLKEMHEDFMRAMKTEE
jgi:hypothetical protein